MSTHYIEEAERLADVVAVMSAGRVIAQGTPAELTRAHAGERVVEVFGPPSAPRGGHRARGPPRLALAPLGPRRRDHARRDARTASCPTGRSRPASLEDAFVALTGEEIE